MDTLQSLEKRTWFYVRSPSHFEVAPCACGNHETQWSEYAGHLWCAKCEKDFVPEHTGILGGPVPIKLATMLGVNFDRFNLAKNCVERFDVETLEYCVEPSAAKMD